MTTTDTTKPPPLQGVASVIPWDAMTDQQKRDHIRLAHGRNPYGRMEWHGIDHSWGNTPNSRYPWFLPHSHDKETP